MEQTEQVAQTAQSQRVRINLSETAKGLVQFDITAEHEDVAECKAMLKALVKAAREVMAEEGLQEVGR